MMEDTRRQVIIDQSQSSIYNIDQSQISIKYLIAGGDGGIGSWYAGGQTSLTSQDGVQVWQTCAGNTDRTQHDQVSHTYNINQSEHSILYYGPITAQYSLIMNQSQTSIL